MEKERWRLKKEISLPDLIALGTALVAVIVAWSNLDKRLALVENALILEKDTRAMVERRVEEQLIRLNERLDKLLERR